MAETIEIPELHIDNFSGPLDLLWDLIKRSKIDVTEVSLSEITEQYIAYLTVMENLNVKVATEFIWMASELLYYKSKALLPVEAGNAPARRLYERLGFAERYRYVYRQRVV